MLCAAWDSKADSFTCEQVFNWMQSDIIYHCEWSNCSDSIILSGTVCSRGLVLGTPCPKWTFTSWARRVTFFTGRSGGSQKIICLMRRGTLNPHKKCTFCCVFFQLNGLNRFFWADGVCLSCFQTTRTVAASKIPWDIGMRQEQNWRDLAAQGCCGPNKVGRIAVIWTHAFVNLKNTRNFGRFLLCR